MTRTNRPSARLFLACAPLLALLAAAAPLSRTGQAADLPRQDGFTPAQRELVRAALAAADSVMSDPTFTAVAGELAEDGTITWSTLNLDLVPADARADPTGWLLARFASEGNYRPGDVGARRRPLTSTTAWTTPCVPGNPRCALRTTLNTKFVYVSPGRTVHAVTNTLVHERAHSFGHKHGESQYRKDNLCDAAYVLGDLAEALLRHRAEGAPIAPREVLCPGLHAALARRGVVRAR